MQKLKSFLFLVDDTRQLIFILFTNKFRFLSIETLVGSTLCRADNFDDQEPLISGKLPNTVTLIDF